MKPDWRETPDPRETPEEAHARRTLDPTAYRKFVNQSLSRHIAAWAKLHEVCPRNGCRRNVRCLSPGNCRVVRDRPPITEEERVALVRQIRQALNARCSREKR